MKESLSATALASLNYDNLGRLSQSTGTTPTPAIAYVNNTALATLAYAPTGAITGQSWSFPIGQKSITETNVLSQSGRVLQNTLTDNAPNSATSTASSTSYVSTYGYDAAGRLTAATVPDNTLTYSYQNTGGCGVNTSAGMDGNRTGYSNTTTGGTKASTTAVTVSYCYDNADRLTADTVTGAPTGASPLLANNLVSAAGSGAAGSGAAGSGQNLVYDAHGNTTLLADQTMSYDQAGRHLSTTTTGAGGATITYIRDVSDQIVSMTTTMTTKNVASTTVHYSFGAGMQFTFNNSNTTVQEQTISLPGGVTDSIRNTTAVWSYPNLHGDNITTANKTGTRASGPVAVYDPFGDPINLTTGQIGTLTANNQTMKNTTTPGAAYGWEGTHLKQTQQTADIATIEMGARQYIPLLGRFLTTDPVAGGNVNDYVYQNDPINNTDIIGMWSWDDTFAVAMIVLTVIDFIPGLDIGSLALQGVMLGVRAASIASKLEKASEVARFAAQNSKLIGEDSKLFGNFTMGRANVPRPPGGLLNRRSASTKLGWSRDHNGAVFRLSSKHLPRKNKRGYGHIDIFRGRNW